FYGGTPPQAFEIFGTRFDTLVASAGWSYDSRNRALFADRGARLGASVGFTIPGSDVEYWTAAANYLQFVPLPLKLAFMFNAEINYGEALGDTTALAPYQRWYAGGPDSIRGYRESRLGPKDSFGNPYGGNLKTVAQAEILFPMPEKWRNSARFSLFYDIGGVFAVNDDTQFVGSDRITPVDYGFGYDKLKRSAGVAVQWLAPLGVFRFSYAIPLNANPADGVYYEDEREGFQFSIGQAF
ncbi:MAG: BamA/TamA family outer membrane protein, partial [Candidatus Obscuribacterales bacterium]|nr:BamA/TamA family outer membrane protein [Steroidobacteraceae bacterium]